MLVVGHFQRPANRVAYGKETLKIQFNDDNNDDDDVDENENEDENKTASHYLL